MDNNNLDFLNNVLVYYLYKTVLERLGASRVKLYGQTQAEGFYQKPGYQTSSDVFMEDGIPHILMVKELLAKYKKKDRSSAYFFRYLSFLIFIYKRGMMGVE